MPCGVNGKGDPQAPDKCHLNQPGRGIEKHGYRHGGRAEKDQQERAEKFTETARRVLFHLTLLFREFDFRKYGIGENALCVLKKLTHEGRL